MPKTTFIDDATVVVAAWLNKVFNHNHRGEDIDGSCPKISLDELDPQLLNMLNSLVALDPKVAQLFFEGKLKVDVFGGYGGDGDFDGSYPLDKSFYEFENFSIPSAYDVAFTSGVTRIKCKGDFVIEGTLFGRPCNEWGIGKPNYPGGKGYAYGLGAGFMGSGGQTAFAHHEYYNSIVEDPGGLGGSAIIVEALGDIVITSTGKIQCNGGNGGASTTVYGFPAIGGSGGGSGGSVILQSYSKIIIDGQLYAVGGNGYNGQNQNAKGGGGGGGGIIDLTAPEINDGVDSYVVTGGLPGFSIGYGYWYGGGGAGFGGDGGSTGQAGQQGKVIKKVTNQFNPKII